MKNEIKRFCIFVKKGMKIETKLKVRYNDNLTYRTDANALKVIPFFTFITAYHIGFIRAFANTVIYLRLAFTHILSTWSNIYIIHFSVFFSIFILILTLSTILYLISYLHLFTFVIFVNQLAVYNVRLVYRWTYSPISFCLIYIHIWSSKSNHLINNIFIIYALFFLLLRFSNCSYIHFRTLILILIWLLSWRISWV
jgi:hypothetical protein